MEQNSAKKFLIEKIDKGEEISPFLFLSRDILSANTYAQNLALEIAHQFEVDKNYIFILSGMQESIKIEAVREFLLKSQRKPSFAFQIFIIEKISELTLQSANSLLKFLEEPWQWNIVFLTNQSEGGVLETILSRVIPVPVWEQSTAVFDSEIYAMIQDYFENKNPKLVSYFFSLEITKDVAKSFLLTIITYIKKTGNAHSVLKEIDEDILWLEKNNLLPKYIVDKYILLLSYDTPR